MVFKPDKINGGIFGGSEMTATDLKNFSRDLSAKIAQVLAFCIGRLSQAHAALTTSHRSANHELQICRMPTGKPL
jgi:hypothetical protein